MAIGDTVQAGLGRMDFSAFQRAGEAQARANQAFGNALGQAATAYFKGKEKKERANEVAQYLIGQGASEEDAKAIAKNPFLQNEYQRKKEAESRENVARIGKSASVTDLLNKQKYEEAKQEQEKQRADRDTFINTLYSDKPTGELNVAGEQEVENFKAFAAPEDPRINPFIEQTLQDPQFQETAPVTSLAGNKFMEAFETPGSRRLAYDYLQSRQAPMTPEQMLDYQVKLNKEQRDQARENREASKFEDEKLAKDQEKQTLETDSTNNLTDFYNETKSLLDKINEKGVDVTGPIEGTSIYRFFSKLGDTDDEQVRRRLEMFTRKLTLDAAQNLKGALSDKDIRFLVEQAPDMDDNPSVWKKYMGDLVLRLERNANQQGIKLGVPQVNPSAPASQSLLDEIERKKQLRSKRAGL